MVWEGSGGNAAPYPDYSQGSGLLEAFDGDAVGRGAELDLAAGGATAGVEGVDHLLAVALVDDDAVHPQQAQVVADGGLGELEFLAQAGDVAFTAGQEHDNLEAGPVREEPEELTQIVE